jgi:ankyrin repeat protein
MARANNALGKTPLHRAAKYSSSEAVVQALLAAYPEAVKATDKLGRMPLHVAARYSSSVSVVQA